MKTTQTCAGLVLGAMLLGLGGLAQAGLIGYTANGVNLVYDNDRDLTWVANANLFKTQWDADNTTVDKIIAAVPTVAGHTLTASDFNTTNGQMTWWGAMAWAQWLDYGGVSDWRLWSALNSDDTGPCDGLNCTGSELGHLFYTEGGLSVGSSINSSAALTAVFTNMQDYVYWSGTQFAPGLTNAWLFYTDFGGQDLDSKDLQYYGWAVRPGQVAAAAPTAVPTLGLWGLGLLGLLLAGLGRGRLR